MAMKMSPSFTARESIDTASRRFVTAP